MVCENGLKIWGTLHRGADAKKNTVSEAASGTRGSSYFKVRSERGFAYDGVSGANKRMKRDLAGLPETAPNHPGINHLAMCDRLYACDHTSRILSCFVSACLNSWLVLCSMSITTKGKLAAYGNYGLHSGTSACWGVY